MTDSDPIRLRETPGALGGAFAGPTGSPGPIYIRR